jgi:hypothetical protein
MIKVGSLLAALLVLAGCGSSGGGGSDTGEARRWLVENSLAARRMRAAADAVELVLGQPNVAQYSVNLTAEVTAVEQRLPTPDETLTRYLQDAAELYGQGATEAANATGSASGLLVKGDQLFKQAVARSEKLGQSIYAPS